MPNISKVDFRDVARALSFIQNNKECIFWPKKIDLVTAM